MSRKLWHRPRHRATLGERATASTLAPVLLVILSGVAVVVGASSVAQSAHPATLSGPPAHTATPAAAGQEWPRIPSSVPLPPVRIDGVTASR